MHIEETHCTLNWDIDPERKQSIAIDRLYAKKEACRGEKRIRICFATITDACACEGW